MKAIELLEHGLLGEEILKIAHDRGPEVHFNGRLVWGDVIAAIVDGRRAVASQAGLSADDVTPQRLEVAAYHDEEQVIYVAVTCALPGRTASGILRGIGGHECQDPRAYGRARPD